MYTYNLILQIFVYYFQHLANPKSRILALLGAGAQARSHYQALSHIQQFDEVSILSKLSTHVSMLLLYFVKIITNDYAMKEQKSHKGSYVIELHCILKGSVTVGYIHVFVYSCRFISLFAKIQ